MTSRTTLRDESIELLFDTFSDHDTRKLTRSRAERLLDKLESRVVGRFLVILLLSDGIASDGEAVYAGVRRALLRKTAVYPKQASKLTRPGIAGRAACRRPDSSS